MSSMPFHTLEDEVYIEYHTFFFGDVEDLSCSFVGSAPDWVEDISECLKVTTQIDDPYASVRLEAWMDEPPAQEGVWNETCEIFIDWTSGTVQLQGSEHVFTFGSTSAAQDYRLRICRSVRPLKDNTLERMVEGEGFSHRERYLFQFWPIVSQRSKFASQEEPDPSSTDAPSERERTILAAFARGQRDVTIAKELKISVFEVKKLIPLLYQKLEVDTQTAAVVKAIRLGWISPGE